MKHVIDRVWGALPLLPLKDRHSQAQLCWLKFKFQADCRFGRIKSTLCLCSVLTTERVLWCLWWRMSEAAQPPPLRPPLLTVFQLPLCLRSLLQLCHWYSLSLSLFSPGGLNSGTHCKCEDLENSNGTVNCPDQSERTGPGGEDTPPPTRLQSSMIGGVCLATAEYQCGILKTGGGGWWRKLEEAAEEHEYREQHARRLLQSVGTKVQ